MARSGRTRAGQEFMMTALPVASGAQARRILITGGCGFIGSNLAAHYLSQGHHVTVLDNFSRRGAVSNAAWLQQQGGGRLQILLGDVREERELYRAMRGAGVVVHLAAQVAVTSSVVDPRHDFMVNALGGFNLLEAARLYGDDPIVLYASTNKVYGALDSLRLKESALRYALRDYSRGIPEGYPLDLHSPYGCSKGSADLYMLDYARIFGLRTVVFRQSCIYGPRQFGVEDQGWVAHFTISAVLGRPITIYGDGRQVRDILHVRDLIRAFDLAVERIDVSRGQAYNLGGGPKNALSLLELIYRLEAGLDHPIPLWFDEWRPGDQRVYISDIRKAERDLGWEPQINVEQGLADLRQWVEGNLGLFEAPPLAMPVAQAGGAPARRTRSTIKETVR
jgi:CDP-paratose 2-epimerase